MTCVRITSKKNNRTNNVREFQKKKEEKCKCKETAEWINRKAKYKKKREHLDISKLKTFNYLQCTGISCAKTGELLAGTSNRISFKKVLEKDFQSNYSPEWTITISLPPPSMLKHSFFNHLSSAQHGIHFKTAFQDFSHAAPIVFNGDAVNRALYKTFKMHSKNL